MFLTNPYQPFLTPFPSLPTHADLMYVSYQPFPYNPSLPPLPTNTDFLLVRSLLFIFCNSSLLLSLLRLLLSLLLLFLLLLLLFLLSLLLPSLLLLLSCTPGDGYRWWFRPIHCDPHRPTLCAHRGSQHTRNSEIENHHA